MVQHAKCIYNTRRLITTGIVGQLNQVKVDKLDCNLIRFTITIRYIPTEFSGYKITVRTVCGRILVHVAYDALLAEIVLYAQLLNDFIDLQQYGTVEWIVVKWIQWLRKIRKKITISNVNKFAVSYRLSNLSILHKWLMLQNLLLLLDQTLFSLNAYGLLQLCGQQWL